MLRFPAGACGRPRALRPAPGAAVGRTGRRRVGARRRGTVLGFAVDRVPTPDRPSSQCPGATVVAGTGARAGAGERLPRRAALAGLVPGRGLVPVGLLPESQATRESSGAAIGVGLVVTFDLSSLPSVQALRGEPGLVATEAPAPRRAEPAVQRGVDHAYAREVADRFAEVLPGIHSEPEPSVSGPSPRCRADRPTPRPIRSQPPPCGKSSQAEAGLLDQARQEAEHVVVGPEPRATPAARNASRRARLREPRSGSGAARRHRFALPPCPQRRRRPERSALVGDVGRLREGRLLVATPLLDDPNFFHAVVWLLEHGDDGALGVVLNRPSGLPVAEPLPVGPTTRETCRCSSSAGPWPSAR